MGETGILTHDDRVELVGGMIVMMTPMGSGHAGVLACLEDALRSRLSGRVLFFTQLPLALSEDSEPEPDLMLLEPRDDYYQSGHPTGQDVHLLVEVADTSLEFDLTTKLALYANAGIREYWVVDLSRRVVIVHRAPRGDAFTSVTEHGRESSIAPQAFPDCSIRLADVVKEGT